jgi:hypothetical protein
MKETQNMKETWSYKLKDLARVDFNKRGADPGFDVRSISELSPKILGEAMDLCLFYEGYSFYEDPYLVSFDMFDTKISSCIIRKGLIDAMMIFDKSNPDAIRLSLLFSAGDDEERDVSTMAAYFVSHAKDIYDEDTVIIIENGNRFTDMI